MTDKAYYPADLNQAVGKQSLEDAKSNKQKFNIHPSIGEITRYESVEKPHFEETFNGTDAARRPCCVQMHGEQGDRLLAPRCEGKVTSAYEKRFRYVKYVPGCHGQPELIGDEYFCKEYYWYNLGDEKTV